MNAARPIAIIADAPAPYRVAFHLRVARELPQYKLISVFTHSQSNAGWSLKLPDQINPRLFGHNDAYGVGALKSVFKDVRKAKAIARLLAREGVEAVIINGYGDAGRLWLMRWCQRRGLPYFVWGDSNIRGDRATGLKRLIKSTLLARVLPRATGMLSCGSLGQAFFERYGVSSERIGWMPYEPDYTLIDAVKPEQIEAAQARFGLAVGRRVLVFSGRLVPAKRPDLVIDAFVSLADERPEWDLLLVGDGPLRDELKLRIPPRLVGRVHWTGFIDEQSTVSALYRASDVLVIPSDFEPWALVVNEAAAAGLAIVASDVVGAAAELVRDGMNGFIFSAGDLAALRAALHSATDASRVDALKGGSADVLADWRRRADPVRGFQRAIEGVLPNQGDGVHGRS